MSQDLVQEDKFGCFISAWLHSFDWPCLDEEKTQSTLPADATAVNSCPVEFWTLEVTSSLCDRHYSTVLVILCQSDKEANLQISCIIAADQQ